MSKSSFERNVLLFAGVIVPQLESDSALQKPFLDNFELLMSGIDADSVEKIKLLVKVLSILSWVYNLKSFQGLNIKQKERFVEKLYRFPVSKLVAGLTGLKALVFIAYYGIPAVLEEIKYAGPIVSKELNNG